MLKKILLSLVFLVGLLAVVFALGPREPADETIRFKSADMGDDLPAYLAKTEGRYSDVKPGAEKQIIWQNPSTQEKTPFSIVYIHGFSASLEEVRPLPDIIANALGANLFYARLAGHGRTGEAMAQASANDWFNDTAEAIAIGEALGDKVILISSSTGGTLITWALSKPELAKNIHANVMIAPNYAIQAEGSEALSLPWARQLLPLAFGQERSWEPKNAEQGKWWTTRYPMVSVLPVQASVNTANAVEFEQLNTPAMFIYHPDDEVVKSEVTRTISKRWGTANNVKTEVVEVADSTDPAKHVIAGRILSPENTQPLAQKAIAWIKSL